MESILSRRGWINYKQLGTDEPINDEAGNDYNHDEVHWSRIRIMSPTRTQERRSKRWILTVAGVALVTVIGIVAGIVIWQTQEVEPNYPGDFSSAAVSCDAPLCANIGRDMLLRNGSVADAAIATLLCMGTLHSQSMGIGGGFFMVMYKDGKAEVLNARETAPAFATEDMFKGNPELAQRGGLAVAIPGEIKGYYELHQRAGKLPWADLFQPTIELCRNGFPVSGHSYNAFLEQKVGIMNTPSMAEIFINPATNDIYQKGDMMKRPQLAVTLEKLANSANASQLFYEGEIAQWLVEDLRDLGGNITMEDMRDYRVHWAEPLEVKVFGDFTLHSVPPPGSGLLMSFILKLLEDNGLSIKNEQETLATYQLITEAFKHAYAQRTQLGDPFDPSISDTVKELIANLTGDAFIADIRQKMDDCRFQTNNTYEYYGAEYYMPDDHGTSHLSIIGPNGDAISVTSTVNLYFGARIRSTRTGIIYNDEMDDFSAPNITNYFGVPPSENNFILPGKRPMSSMTPAIFTDGKGRVRLVVGAAGGTRITTATSLVSIRNLLFNESINAAIIAPRFHHQIYPMAFQHEIDFPVSYVKGMEGFGHSTNNYSAVSSVTIGVAVDASGRLYASSDPRKDGSVAGF